MSVQEIAVRTTDDENDIQGKHAELEAARILGRPVGPIHTERIFFVDAAIRTAGRLGRRLLANPLTEKSQVNPPPPGEHSLTIGPKPAVLDAVADTVVKTSGFVDATVRRAATALRYLLPDTVTAEERDLLAAGWSNPIVDKVHTERPTTLEVIAEPDEGEGREFFRKGHQRALEHAEQSFRYMSREKLQAIADYAEREDRPLSLGEMHAIEAWWSEHCYH